MKKVIIAYVPVLHAGYISFLERHQPSEIILLDSASVRPYDSVIADRWTRDMRALAVSTVQDMLYRHFAGKVVVSSGACHAHDLLSYDEVVMLDEDISHVLKSHVSESAVVTFDTQFLRWDWAKTVLPQHFDDKEFPVSADPKHVLFMEAAYQEGARSSDWWRHVGAAVPYGEGMLLTAFNRHMPFDDAPNVFGDPRNAMRPGEMPHICSAIHGEMSVFAKALHEGVCMKGLDLFVTTFPCPVCARMIVGSGIKRVFFAEGYSIMDSLDILRRYDVEVIKVLCKI